MHIEKIEKNGTFCAFVRSDEIVITDVQSALDLLMTAKYDVGTKNIVIDKKLIKEDFFVLSSGLAGEILQKYISYGGRIAIYGDYSHYTSKPLHDFIYESNQGNDVFFTATKNEAVCRLTRAKDNLYIHCNNAIFDSCQIDGVDIIEDETQYPEPREITLQLTHKDVVLDFFKDKKEIIFKMHSGMMLSVKDEFLYAELDGRTVRVAKLSKSRMAELEKLSAKGYYPVNGEVRFVVAWKGENDLEETAVLLPNLHFKKDDIKI